MTLTQAKQKIAAARQMTAANQDRHKIHLERGYLYLSVIEMLSLSLVNDSFSLDGVFEWRERNKGFDLHKKFIWAINSESKLVMI